MALPAQQLSLEDYLAWENQQPGKNEFYRGEVFAMVGVRRVHALIGGNLFASFKSHLKGSPCRAFTESVKVQVARDAIFYPDVFVTCDSADLTTEMVFHRPVLIVEVLSPGTESFDRSLKFTAYRQIETLREYVLIDPDTRSVEVFRRNERGLFELHDQTHNTHLHLASIDMHLAMAEVFDGLDVAASAAAAPP